MKKQAKYSEELKNLTIKLVIVDKKTILEVAKFFFIPEGTLRRWVWEERKKIALLEEIHTDIIHPIIKQKEDNENTEQEMETLKKTIFDLTEFSNSYNNFLSSFYEFLSKMKNKCD
jgi:hypothetical protein